MPRSTWSSARDGFAQDRSSSGIGRCGARVAGNAAVIPLEANDGRGALTTIGTSHSPFVPDHARDVHDVSPTSGVPPPSLEWVGNVLTEPTRRCDARLGRCGPDGARPLAGAVPPGACELHLVPGLRLPVSALKRGSSDEPCRDRTYDLGTRSRGSRPPCASGRIVFVAFLKAFHPGIEMPAAARFVAQCPHLVPTIWRTSPGSSGPSVGSRLGISTATSTNDDHGSAPTGSVRDLRGAASLHGIGATPTSRTG